jgi:hypothetical protein
MIIFAKPSKPFSYTPKGTTRRHAIIKEYDAEIEELYTTMETASQPTVPPPAEWNPTSTRAFVRVVVRTVMAQEVRDDQDLFEHGCDRLVSDVPFEH